MSATQKQDDRAPFGVGEQHDFTRHTFRNEVGGTEFGDKVTASITKVWFDYETGWHAHGRTDGGRTVFLSEFDRA